MELELSHLKELGLDELVEASMTTTPVSIAAQSIDRIAKGWNVVTRALESDQVVYGLTRHLGDGRDRKVTPEELSDNQKRTVIGHANTVGERMTRGEVRALMLARLQGFAEGYSGISPETVQRYVDMINQEITPVVRRFGSVGASDLAPLAVIAVAAIGEGVVEYKGEERRSSEVFDELNLPPLSLGGKDGLAMVSSNSYSIGVGAIALREFAAAFSLVEMAAALHLEATRGNLSWLDEECAAARPFAGQGLSATRLRTLMSDSALFQDGVPRSLQDPLSIRSFSHVAGAVLEVAQRLADDVSRELNSSGDNPMVSPDSGRIISSANFNPVEISLGFESLRVGIAHLAIISDRRIQRLAQEMWGGKENLLLDGPMPFGFSAISAKLKALAHPIGIELPPTARGHEDMLSGGPLAVDATREAIGYLRVMALGEITFALSIIIADKTQVGTRLRPLVERAKTLMENAPYPRAGSALMELLADEFTDDASIHSLFGNEQSSGTST